MSGDRTNSAAAALRRDVGLALRALGTDLDRLDDSVARRFGLHRTDLRCLEIVARCGPMTAGALAVQAGLSASAVTSVIDRVQGAGYLERGADPADRRRVVVALTEQGRQHGRAAFAGLMTGTDRLLAGYSAAQLQMIRDLLAKVRALVTEQAAAADGTAGAPAEPSPVTRGEG